MTYGVEAVIPLESGFLTTRTTSFNPKDNDEHLARVLGPDGFGLVNALAFLLSVLT